MTMIARIGAPDIHSKPPKASLPDAGVQIRGAEQRRRAGTGKSLVVGLAAPVADGEAEQPAGQADAAEERVPPGRAEEPRCGWC
ncbi:MAG: hypothetical protein U0802_22360 [Candidatus Binatia bacterium]